LATTTNPQFVKSIHWYDELVASPKKIAVLLLEILAGIVAIALILKIFIKRHIQFPKLILNGFLLLAIILVLIIINFIANFFNHGIV